MLTFEVSMRFSYLGIDQSNFTQCECLLLTPKARVALIFLCTQDSTDGEVINPECVVDQLQRDHYELLLKVNLSWFDFHYI